MTPSDEGIAATATPPKATASARAATMSAGDGRRRRKKDSIYWASSADRFAPDRPRTTRARQGTPFARDSLHSRQDNQNATTRRDAGVRSRLQGSNGVRRRASMELLVRESVRNERPLARAG